MIEVDCFQRMNKRNTRKWCHEEYRTDSVSFDGILGQIDCKLIGSETPCFCTHSNGSKPVRCQCKCTTSEHSEATNHRSKKCTHCKGYRSPFTCGCGQPGFAHVTLVETREERMARGYPVGRAVPYAAMGGLTGFSSLADYLSLDPSGICKAHRGGAKGRPGVAVATMDQSLTTPLATPLAIAVLVIFCLGHNLVSLSTPTTTIPKPKAFCSIATR
ncbi:protein FAM221A-like [Myxocyprinus asiaticus]|uniref:protein FAM221A-like n=1 Tax=Myxocyprinus asiaticus TaxID=70543 RepID=UPI00222309AB|nr:protein FAM221A-like [Myxocyprinus asiaticus]